jgi:putative ABC transport system permease protein
MILIEALLLCMFAAAVGLALAASVFQSPQLRVVLGPMSMPAPVLLVGGAIAAGLAFISGLPPAWRAKRLNIVEALAVR